MEFTSKEILEICFNGVLAFFTAVLAIFTWLLYKETKRTRKQNATPQISVYFYPITNIFLGIKIENTGHVDAKDINLVCLNSNIYKDKNHNFVYAEKLSKKLSCLSPGQLYSFSVGYYAILEKEVFDFDISFTSMNGEIKVSHHFSMDMDLLHGMLVEKEAEEKLVVAVENFGKNFSRIIESDNGRKGIRAYSYSVEDRQIEKRKQEQDFYRWQPEPPETKNSKD